ncbi:MAG TPA: ABC transporter permease [Nitrososphaerales archaeon]|nr:ABC transporter permease [Nitrososphaerales archaeon]
MSSQSEFIQIVKTNKVVDFALAYIILVTISAIFANYIAPYHYAQFNLSNVLQWPSWAHPFGTDYLGRDIFSRMIYGARLSLFGLVIAVSTGAVIGVPIGLISGYYSGKIDLVISRIADVLLAFPGILLAFALVAILGIGLVTAALSLGITMVPRYIRIVRSQTLEIKQHNYIEIAKVNNVGGMSILFKHVLPNAIGPILIQVTFNAASAVLGIAALGFLGLGAQPPLPEWGTMLNEAQSYMMIAPYLMVPPGVAITLLVISLNIIGEAVRDALDPKRKYIGLNALLVGAKQKND